MKGYLVNKKQSQSGSAHLVVIVVLVVALLGALGYVFYLNFMQPKVADVPVLNIPKTNDGPTVVVPAETIDNNVSAVAQSSFITLEDWGIKFNMPTRLAENNKITYQKKGSASDEYYSFSTTQYSALGANCSEIWRLSRSQKEIPLVPGAPLSAGHVGNYYYGINGPQAACSNDGKDIQNRDYDMLKNTLLTLKAI